jgi:hypothetical protein
MALRHCRRTQERDATAGHTLWVPCPGCSTNTNHLIVTSVDVESDYDFTVFSEHHQVVQCCGCDAVSFRRHWYSTDDTFFDEDQNEEVVIENEDLFPPRAVGRPVLSDLHSLPSSVQAIYLETHKALCSQLPILASVGIRALVEAVGTERGASGRTLSEKIDSLLESEVLTPIDARILHRLRDMGNKSAHEVKPHAEHDLATAFDVVEHLIRAVYVLPLRTGSRDQEPGL